MDTPEWRKRPGSDVWHFVKSCRWWPPYSMVAYQAKPKLYSFRKPKSGEFCNECRSKFRRGIV